MNSALPLHFGWENTEVHVGHWIPEFPRGIKLQSPTCVTGLRLCPVVAPSLPLFIPCSLNSIPSISLTIYIHSNPYLHVSFLRKSNKDTV